MEEPTVCTEQLSTPILLLQNEMKMINKWWHVFLMTPATNVPIVQSSAKISFLFF